MKSLKLMIILMMCLLFNSCDNQKEFYLNAITYQQNEIKSIIKDSYSNYDSLILVKKPKTITDVLKISKVITDDANKKFNILDSMIDLRFSEKLSAELENNLLNERLEKKKELLDVIYMKIKLWK